METVRMEVDVPKVMVDQMVDLRNDHPVVAMQVTSEGSMLFVLLEDEEAFETNEFPRFWDSE